MFREANTAEQLILDACVHLGWRYVHAPVLSRGPSDVFAETMFRDALIKLNPEIATAPERADEVLYKLRAILLAVQNDGLVRSNEAMAEWLQGDKTMPFGPNGEHTSVRLIDFDNPLNNDFLVCNQWTYQSGQLAKRFDIVLLVNGLPIVIGEAKTPVRPAVTWVDGAIQVHDDYEQSVPAMFVTNVFSFATEGKAFRYGSVRMPIDLWGPWRDAGNQTEGKLSDVRKSITSMFRPEVVLDILQNFTLFATDKKHRRIKTICRYQQYQGTNLIVNRVVEGQIKKGLIWHFQGSGKSLLMVFTAQKLRMHLALGNPAVLIVVDRVDLDTQISATFNAADVPNLIKADSREELQTLLARDARKVIITTIHKFGEAEG
ncbi:MAG: type I restriction endonuclease, partial [Schlesneria sp.]